MIDQLTSLVIYNSNAIDRILRYAVKDFGLRWSALRVLGDLVHGGPLTQKELVEIEQLKQATVSVLLQEMSDEKLIAFRRNPRDGRSKLVVITKKGRGAYQRCGECIRPVIGQLLSSLSTKEVKAASKSESNIKRCINEYFLSA
jgi:DNA-binding MarR family transcriptional regulator